MCASVPFLTLCAPTALTGLTCWMSIPPAAPVHSSALSAYTLVPAGMLSTNNAVSPSIATRAAFYRELAAGEYGVWAFYVAQGAAEVPYAVLQAIFFLVPYNALIGFPWSAFPFYLLASIVFYTFASMVGQAIAAISPTEEIALTIAPLLNTVLNVLSGFLIKRDDIPSYWYVPRPLCAARVSVWRCRTWPAGTPSSSCRVAGWPHPRVLRAHRSDSLVVVPSPLSPALPDRACVLALRLPLCPQDLALLRQPVRVL